MTTLKPRTVAAFALTALILAPGLVLGGEAETPKIEILNARTPLPGVLSGGQVTQEQLAEAAAAGYRTVVSLRMPEELQEWDEPSTVEGLGMRFVSLPIAGAEGITPENAKKLAALLDEKELRPMVLHCGSGNRIGALFALIAFDLEGKDAESALQVGKDAGLTRLEPVVREKLGLPPLEPPEEKKDGPSS